MGRALDDFVVAPVLIRPTALGRRVQRRGSQKRVGSAGSPRQEAAICRRLTVKARAASPDDCSAFETGHWCHQAVGPASDLYVPRTVNPAPACERRQPLHLRLDLFRKGAGPTHRFGVKPMQTEAPMVASLFSLLIERRAGRRPQESQGIQQIQPTREHVFATSRRSKPRPPRRVAIRDVQQLRRLRTKAHELKTWGQQHTRLRRTAWLFLLTPPA